MPCSQKPLSTTLLVPMSLLAQLPENFSVLGEFAQVLFYFIGGTEMNLLSIVL